MNRLEMHKEVIEHYGWKHQVVKLIDEMNELKVELLRYVDKKDNLDLLIDEFGDVLNMIEQFEIIAKEKELFTHLDVDKVQNYKMKRELNRINNLEV